MSNLYSFARWWLSLAVAAMLCSCGGSSGSDGEGDAIGTNAAVTAANSTVPDNVFTATLGAAQEVPPSGSTASGIGVVMVDPASRLMRATLTTAGMTGTSAQIHIAPTGATGPGVFPMVEAPAGSGIWSAQTMLTEEQLSTLRNGHYYFNVRSIAFSEGEIRGQIVPQLPASGVTSSLAGTALDTSTVSKENFNNGSIAGTTPGNISGTAPTSSTTGTTIGPGGLDTSGSTGTSGTVSLSGANRRITFVNVLTGTQQVPPSGSSTIAIGVAILDEASRTIVASITSLGISGISAHVHKAPAGSSGDPVFALNETSTGSGIWAARLAVSESELDAFARGSRYFDIHTTAFPNGEIRGQITATSGTGKFRIGSNNAGTPADAIGISPQGGTPPFVTDTGIVTSGASVPTFGNPTGSGVGSGSSGFTGTSNPTFGNPAGSGIGGSSTSTGFSDTPVSMPTDIGTGTVSTENMNNTGSVGTAF